MKPEWKTNGERLASAETDMRDALAMSAMNGLVGQMIVSPSQPVTAERLDALAASAYIIADSMLRARCRR
jgi:hypothetical protein